MVFDLEDGKRLEIEELNSETMRVNLYDLFGELEDTICLGACVIEGIMYDQHQ